MTRPKMTSLKMLRQNDICCSQPPLDPNYTVCFPAQQVIPGGSTQANPFYDVANSQSFWTYTIQIDSDSGQQITDLSHWDVQMCIDLLEAAEDDPDAFFTVDVSSDGVNFTNITDLGGSIEALPGGDPSIDTVPVLKINFGQATGTTRIYRITILGTFFDLAAEPGTVLIKHGDNPSPGFQVFSPSTCGANALPTPSINCVRQQFPELTLDKECPEPPPGRDFDVGDTVTITLTVTNTGDTEVTDFTVLDLIRVPSCVTISSLTISDGGTAAPLLTSYTNVDILVTWSGLTIDAGETITLTVTFTILRVRNICCFIINVDAGIGQLSGTSMFTCTIPLQAPLPKRGLLLQNFIRQ